MNEPILLLWKSLGFFTPNALSTMAIYWSQRSKTHHIYKQGWHLDAELNVCLLLLFRVFSVWWYENKTLSIKKQIISSHFTERKGVNYSKKNKNLFNWLRNFIQESHFFFLEKISCGIFLALTSVLVLPLNKLSKGFRCTILEFIFSSLAFSMHNVKHLKYLHLLLSPFS